jgi:low affinity Fe/Cu permease
LADSSIGKRANCRCSVGRARAFLMGLVVSEQKLSSWFGRFTAGLARFIGRPAMLFFCALLAVGSIAAYASHDGLLIDGTNLAINVLTLLFLPILQATQNRDGAALQAKLDELIKSNKEARNDLIGIEDLPEEQIEELRAVPDTVTDPRPAEPVA